MEDLFAVVAAAAEQEQAPAARHQRRLDLARRFYVTQRRSLPTAAELTGVTVDELVVLLEEQGLAIRSRSKPHRPRVSRKIDEAEMAKVLAEEYRAGYSINTLSLRHQLGKLRTRELIEAGGATIRPTGSKPHDFTPERYAEIVRLYVEEKLSYHQIADRLPGVSMYRIVRALDGQDVPKRAFKRRPKSGEEPPGRAEIERLRRRYEVELVPIVRLAREEGWDWRRLRDLLRAEGATMRGPGPVPRAGR